MSAVLLNLIRICFLSANPQDLPASRQLVVALGAALLVVLIIGYSILPLSTSPIVLAIGHGSVIAASWFILLKLTNRMDRWRQASAALFGCNALLNLVSLPMLASGARAAESALARSETNLAVYTFMLLWFWEIAVVSRILRETLEVKNSIAIALSLLLALSTQYVLINLFGPSL